MTRLRLGPLLRYVDGDGGGTATVWVEADRPSTAEVRCGDGAYGTSRTFRIAGHHYALIPVTGLTPGTDTPYEVLLDDRRVWPPEDSRFPPSTIRTPAVPDPELRVSFGSCRWASPPHDEPDPIGPDALDTLATRIAGDPAAARPDVLLLLGDQVYADETSKATRRRLAERRDLSEPPGAEVADYEEYTHLYDESWSDPAVRWLLSTVPSCMIFDDHDLIDDWNTSASWLADMRAKPWWQERVLGGLMSYWVYQHLGNLSPGELAADKLYASVRAEPDGTELLRRFASEADRDPACARWSYRRDFGRTRLVMVDSRAARVLAERDRAMLDEAEARWVRDQVLDGRRTEDRGAAGGGPGGPPGRGPYDHLLIGTSLPWLLPPFIHDVESWDSALCGGERGPRWARFGERLRRAADLEHWAAFPDSFEELAALIAEAGSGPDAPATVCVLSGDVHHAYVAEPSWTAGDGPDARIVQLTCSPVHNSVPGYMKLGFRFSWSGPARRLGHALIRHGRVARSSVNWRKTGGPWFGNQLMTLTLRGRSADLRLEQARARGRAPEAGPTPGAELVTVQERSLTP
ncbi:alkaline phosphatase D family protein [Streptomyces scopuliridis]|uniref:Alkaline phosphatase n=1 Tax=Streptomyces scopuliridis RB72 TaxID=1440053 RepID=A0A2T7T818_9ACTN|nr:alkaline phosphatase D family protein [Streptomyces scopuliridis]PVE11309.1 alkaline phosphatase [Streptomyces scopuliridis RB72]